VISKSFEFCRSYIIKIQEVILIFADSHCHINMDYFKDDYKKVANRAFSNGVKILVTIGTNYNDSKRGVEIAEEIDYV
jgi:Tat protein secretion system quality control protein TatD with DNase activity